MKVPFYRHVLNRNDANLVGDVLDTPFLTSGPIGKTVEGMIASYFDVPHAALTSSWTTGAFATLLALDIGPGDEVIVPAMTFAATSNVAELLGAKPVFVDVDPGTILMTPSAVAKALTPRTKAVIPVHLYGQMCDIEGIARVLSGRPDVALIEDAAHTFEAERDGYKPGRHATCAIFSFYATKNVTCGEGGAVITRDDGLFAKLMQTRSHGMSAAAINRYSGARYQHWDLERLGFKANLPDLLACLLPRQIETITARRPNRQYLAQRYRDAFQDGPLSYAAQVPNAESAEHLFVIHVPRGRRDDAIAALNARDIGVAVHYRAVPTTKYYRDTYGYTPEDFPNAYAWGEGAISLPLFDSLTETEQDWVIRAVQEDVYPLVQSKSDIKQRA